MPSTYDTACSRSNLQKYLKRKQAEFVAKGVAVRSGKMLSLMCRARKAYAGQA